MDLSILIAALGLIVAALAEARSIWKDKTKDQIKPIGINILRLIFVLDEIVKSGNELLYIISFIPLTYGEKAYLASVKSKQWDILKIVKRQLKNLERFNEIYESSLVLIDSKASISVGKAIELYIPAMTIERGFGKARYLQALTWKLLESEAPISVLSLAAHAALRDCESSIKINEQADFISFKFSNKVKVKYSSFSGIKVDKQQMVTYDLSKPKDLRQIMENAKNQLDEIKNLRQQLAQVAMTSFSIDELLKSQ